MHTNLKGLRTWKKHPDIADKFSIKLTNIDFCLISGNKKTQLTNLILTNTNGKSFKASVTGKRVKTMIGHRIYIPEGDWTLTGEASRNCEVKLMPRVKLPTVLRKYIKTVKFPIDKIGSFGKRFNPKSEKAINYSKILARRLAIQQEEDGSWASSGYSTDAFHTSICGLGLLAFNDPQYNGTIRKAAHYVATGRWAHWAYSSGTRLIFLAEYYLRTRDKKIIPGLRMAVKMMHRHVLADYTAGHGLGPGYGGSGYIGAGGPISCGLAVASKTGICDAEDLLLLDKMLSRIQELAPAGIVPYARRQQSINTTPSPGQGGACGTGPYFSASLIRGGATLFSQMAKKRYGLGPWGSAEDGHAVQTIHYGWGMISSANCGNAALVGSMTAYLWKLTTLREFDGFINKNNYSTEFHNGDGVIGEPYWRTGIYLTFMNAYKRNLAITGCPKYMAKKRKDTSWIFHRDVSDLNFVKRNWFLVEAALGKEAPGTFRSALKRLNQIPKDKDLSVNLRDFLKTEAPACASAITAQVKKNKYFNKNQLIELIYGFSIEASCTLNLTPGNGITTDSRKQYGASKKEAENEEPKRLYNSEGMTDKEIKNAAKKAKAKFVKDLNNKKAGGDNSLTEYVLIFRPTSFIRTYPGDKKSPNNYESGLFNISDLSIIVSDPTKKYIKKPITITEADLKGNDKHFAQLIKLNAQFEGSFNVKVNYRLGNTPIHYTCKLAVPSSESRSVTPNLTRIKVKGTTTEDYKSSWTCRLKLATGRVIACEGPAIPTDNILSGTPCIFEISPTGGWGHSIRAVKKLIPGYRIATPSTITGSSVLVDKENINDFDPKTSATLSSPHKEEVSITYSFAKPVIITSMQAKFDSKIVTSLEAFIGGKWVLIRIGLQSSDYIYIPTTRSNKFRLSMTMPREDIRINEINFHLPAKKRSPRQIIHEYTW